MTLPVCRQPTGREVGEERDPVGLACERAGGRREGTPLTERTKSGRARGARPPLLAALTSTPVLPPLGTMKHLRMVMAAGEGPE